MTKYVEVTKLMAGTPDKENIEIGKKYEVSEEDLTGVYVYANRGHKKYFLFNEQFKYVEQNEEGKEVPTLKANVDLKSVIQAKVDELRNEAEHLFKKRDRLEQQAINLNKKAQKLKEVIETIKEFE